MFLFSRQRPDSQVRITQRGFIHAAHSNYLRYSIAVQITCADVPTRNTFTYNPIFSRFQSQFLPIPLPHSKLSMFRKVFFIITEPPVNSYESTGDNFFTPITIHIIKRNGLHFSDIRICPLKTVFPQQAFTRPIPNRELSIDFLAVVGESTRNYFRSAISVNVTALHIIDHGISKRISGNIHPETFFYGAPFHAALKRNCFSIPPPNAYLTPTILNLTIITAGYNFNLPIIIQICGVNRVCTCTVKTAPLHDFFQH